MDAYHLWLGIPPEEQPPTYYRLLGVKTFESNADVIQMACDRQMGHVRTFQSGPHAAISQRILNELSAAKLCLLKPATREAYNLQLSAAMTEAAPAAAAMRSAEAASPPVIPDRQKLLPRNNLPIDAPKKPAFNAAHWLGLGVSLAACAAVGLIFVLWLRSQQELAPPAEAVASVAQTPTTAKPTLKSVAPPQTSQDSQVLDGLSLDAPQPVLPRRPSPIGRSSPSGKPSQAAGPAPPTGPQQAIGPTQAGVPKQEIGPKPAADPASQVAGASVPEPVEQPQTPAADSTAASSPSGGSLVGRIFNPAAGMVNDPAVDPPRQPYAPDNVGNPGFASIEFGSGQAISSQTVDIAFNQIRAMFSKDHDIFQRMSDEQQTPTGGFSMLGKVLDGPAVALFARGGLKTFGSYDHGKREGNFRVWNEFGQRQLFGQYLNGREQGIVCVFRGGLPWYAQVWDKREMHSEWMVAFPSGGPPIVTERAATAPQDRPEYVQARDSLASMLVHLTEDEREYKKQAAENWEANARQRAAALAVNKRQATTARGKALDAQNNAFFDQMMRNSLQRGRF